MLKRFFTSISCIFCNLFTINVIRRYKGHIVGITLIFSLACCAIVLYPSFDKFFANSNRQTQFKVFDSGLNLGKFGTEKGLDVYTSRPVYRDGVKSFYYREEFTSKSSSGITADIVPLSIDCKAMINQGHNKNTTNTKQPNIDSRKVNSKDIHPVLLSLIPMYLFSIYCWYT